MRALEASVDELTTLLNDARDANISAHLRPVIPEAPFKTFFITFFKANFIKTSFSNSSTSYLFLRFVTPITDDFPC